MSAHQPILPSRAIELVEAKGLNAAGSLLADFAAAGLIKTYALMREIRPTGGAAETVRDCQLPPEDWDRIVAAGQVPEALTGRTVRIEGSPLQGGHPSVLITGVSFSEASLIKVLERYCANAPATIFHEPPARMTEPQISSASTTPSQDCKPIGKQVPPIKPGDLTATVAQAVQATGLGRTKIDQLMRDGTLERTKVGRRTLISVESIERLVGAKVTK
ncbi:MAG: hypothetical protein B7Y88_12985 [Sphingomonadales bacterium 32-64-17]|nr:MAG: hypothetical protein B7Y88_12985 [Sphingomonadales bacterium 32-64-17]